MDIFPFLVLTGAIVSVIAVIAWGVTTIVKARHGYAIDNSLPGGPARKIELLEQENDRLRGTVDRLEDRLAVLERIATDPKRRLTDEIDSLR